MNTSTWHARLRDTDRTISMVTMLTKPLLSSAIVFTVLSLVWTPAPGFELLAIVTACLASVFAALQAGDVGRYVWMMGFGIIAALLNPVLPMPLGGASSLVLLPMGLVCLVVWVHVLDRLVPGQTIAEVLRPPDK